MQKFFRIENVKCFHFLMVCSSLIVFFYIKMMQIEEKGKDLNLLLKEVPKIG